MFTISNAAATQISKAMQQENFESGMALRIAAQISADRSIHYSMGFDSVADPSELHIIEDIQILLDDASFELLDEATLDYVELEAGAFEFIFMNPLDPSYVAPLAAAE